MEKWGKILSRPLSLGTRDAAGPSWGQLSLYFTDKTIQSPTRVSGPCDEGCTINFFFFFKLDR